MKRRIVSYLLTFAMILSLMPAVVFAAGNSLQLSNTTGQAGDTVTLTYTIPNATDDIGAINITIKYDENVFEATSISCPILGNTNPVYATTSTNGTISSSWSSTTGFSIGADTTIVTATLSVLDTAAVGSSIITVDEISITEFSFGDEITTSGADNNPIVFIVYQEVSSLAISNLDVPIKGATPQTDITATEYTGSITWDPTGTTFAADTIYTATVTLTANAGYQFTNPTAITVAGAYSVSTPTVAADGSTITFTATFPKTASKLIQDLTFTEPTVTKTYGDAVFTITASQTPASGGGAVTYASNDTTVATVTNSGEVTILKAGSTTITATAAENDDYTAATASYTLTVAPLEATLSWSGNSFNYDGNEHAPTATVSNLISGDSCTVTVAGAQTNAGSYTATATELSNANYKLPANATYGFTINTVAATVDTAPAAASGLTYDGSAKALVTAGTATGGEMQYRLAPDSTYSAEIPTGTNAGTYNVYYKVEGDANHNDVPEAGPVEVTIAKGTNPATLTATEVSVKISNSKDLSSLVSGAVGTVSYAITGGTLTDCSLTGSTFQAGTTTGDCVVTITVTDSENNYNDKTLSLTVKVVEKDTQTLTFLESNVTKTYGDGDFTVTAIQTPASGGGAVTYASSDTDVATVTNSGEVTILKAGTTTITATAAENTNYLSATASYTLTVEKAPLTIKAKDHTITYGDAPANNGVEYSGFKGNDTQSVVNGSVTYDYSYTQYGAVGSNYTITPVVSGLSADNYTFTAVAGKLTVNPKEAVLSWTEYSFDYDGFAHAPTATVENLAPGDSCDVTVSGGQTDAGDYTATATALSNTNYKLPDDATHAFKINKAASSVDTVPAAVSGLEYTGSAMALVTAGTADGGEMQYSLTSGGTYSATIPTGTDAGNYNVYYKVVGDNNHNDTTEAGPVAVTIAKGTDPAKLTATTVNVKLEGTDDLSALVSDAVGDVSYTITSALDGCSVAADGTFTAGAAEGTCVVTVAVAESTNYNGKTVGTITVNVMPVVETPVLSESSQTFSGTLNVTINCTTGAAIYYTLDGTDPTSASTPYAEGDTISITETTTLKVIAVMPGYLDSEIAEATYTKASSGGSGGAAAPETNTITPATAENGTVTVSPKEAAAGDTVTITPTPDEGYQVAKVVVKDADGNEIEVTEKDGKYTFTMPDSAVTIETVFEEASETPSDTGRFIDVHEGDYYYEPVEWAAENGITNGITKDKFGPALGCTRAQVVTFLWIAYGSQDAGTETGFDDVDLSAYYDKAVAWAVSEGITAGTAPNVFSPDLTVTRCQFVTMLWVSRGMPEAEGTMPFTDVPADAYYAKAVAWAYANDITAGKSATKFAPDDPCTRGQIVTFLYNALAE